MVADESEKIRLVSLASGSSGNSLLVQHGSTAGLIDCGIGPNRLRSELLAFGLRLSDLSFVFVSHEHVDHIRSLPALVRAGVPVVTGAGTANVITREGESFRVKHGARFECGAIELTAVRISHDAAEPLAAVVSLGEVTAAVFTDMGEWDDVTVDAMCRADVIVVEANHNLEMLKRGPYPAYLKRRVLSSVGHLSNEDCGRLTAMVQERSGRSPAIYLAHLSETNNTPRQAVTDVGLNGGWNDASLTALPRNRAIDLLANPPSIRRAMVDIQQPLFALEETRETGA